MKKFAHGILSGALVAALLVSASPTVFAAEPEYNGTLDEVSTLLAETGYVLVEDGVPRVITEEEYVEIVNSVEYDEPAPQATNDSDEEITTRSYIPSFFYTFKPTSSEKSYLLKYYKVSPTYVSSQVSTISVTETHTESRTVTNSAGFTLTAEVKNAIFNGVSASYSYSTSATSSKSSSVTGVMKPKTQYTYSAVYFQPRIYTVTGNLNYYQSYQGTSTLLSSGQAKAQYPCTTSSGILDGIYFVYGANNMNSYP